MLADTLSKVGTETLPERRQVTALYYDLVGSTVLAAKLDPEDFRQIRRKFHETCSEVVRRYEGHINGFSGDGAMAFFGYPGIHEDDAERAIRAGLEIVAGCGALSYPEQGTLRPIAVRVGIATGLVVAGGSPDGKISGFDDIIGLAPNLASKIQAESLANSVTISETTHDLAGSLFHTVPLPSVLLREVSQPVKIWQVVRNRRFQTRYQATRSFMTTPLISRDRELGQLAELWRSAASGTGQAVFVSGEAGIGKSRLLAAAINVLAVPKHARLIIQCSSQHCNSPLFPVIDMIKRLVPGEQNPAPEEIVNRVLHFVPNRANDLQWTEKYLRLLLGSTNATEGLGGDHTPATIKERTLASLLAVLEALVDAHPFVLAVEDAHWIDATTQELVALLVQRAPKLRVLLLVTHRPGYNHPNASLPNIHHLSLNRLSADESVEIIGRVTGELALAKNVVREIIKMADGVPLFLEELCHSVVKQAKLHSLSKDHADRPNFEIPSSLSDLLGSRLDQLGRNRDIVQIASAIGPEFSAGLLHRVSLSSPELVAAALMQMVDLGLASAHGADTQLKYTFKHALIQEAAYASMMNATRQTIHSRIAECLQQDGDAVGFVSPDVLAHHYSKSGQLNKAISCLIDAGRLAALRSANVEALNLYDEALSLNAHLPASVARDETELLLLVAEGTLRISVNGPGDHETQTCYERAVALCDKLGNGPHHFPALWGWWRVAPNFKITQERADKLSQYISEVDDEQLHLQAHHCQWATLFNSGNQRECCRHIEDGLRLYDAATHNAHGVLYGGHDAKVCALGEKGLALWLLGSLGQSLEAADACLREAETLNHSGTTAHSREIEIMLHRFRRDGQAVLQRAAFLEDFSRQISSRDLEAKSNIFRGWAMAQLGDPRQGAELIEKGLAAQRAVGTEEDFPVYHEMLAETYGIMNQPRLGLKLIEEAISISDNTGLLYWSAELYRRKGELLLQLDRKNRNKASACFAVALAKAKSQAANSLVLRVGMSLVRNEFEVLNEQNSTELLRSALASFSDGFDTADLTQAARLVGA